MREKIKQVVWIFIQIILAVIVFYLVFCITAIYRLEKTVETVNIATEGLK